LFIGTRTVRHDFLATAEKPDVISFSEGGLTAMLACKRSLTRFVAAACLGLAGLGLFAGPILGQLAKEPLSLAEFEKLHSALQPPKDELWQSIPWQVSVLEARRLAAKEKKPIVMRVRAGHPLGCV
jgi:hypothetical protein